MGGSTRGRRRRRTSEEILDLAAELLLEGGAEGFSLRELARRADYTPGALYGYFPSKEALLDALAERVLQRLGDALGAVPTGTPAVRRLADLGDAYLAFATSNPDEYLLLFTRIPAPGELSFDDPQAAPTPWRHVIDAVRAGVAGGEIPGRGDVEARAVFFHFFALHHGLAMLRLTRMRALPDPVFAMVAGGARSEFLNGVTVPPRHEAGDGPKPTRTLQGGLS
jgi:AcrR family transcriptional regulator